MPDRPARGGIVASVDTGPAADAGLVAGDVVVSVDGVPVRDVIDWWWLTDEPHFEVEVLRKGTRISLEVQRTPQVPLGVTFADPLFDGIRECENACAFCFVSALPAGLRPSLYVRDDDYRLSFLSGNFVTLTNVSDDDVERIVEQHLSPLHVSVHAVSPEVRVRLLCPTVSDDALSVLDELLAGGIEVHVQVVLVPGVNDGAVLEETLTYLEGREGVLSVGCVPMAFTAHQSRWDSSYDSESAARVLRQVASWQTRMRASRGVGWVYAADEFFLLAGEALPPAEAYDGFPQYENGIGMASAFLDEFRPRTVPSDGYVLVTGTLFAPLLRRTLDDAGWKAVRVLPVTNRLFGGNVGVAGLLGGNDIVSAIREDGGKATYYVPDVVINSDGLLLDDVPAFRLEELSGAAVRFVGSDARSLVKALTEREAPRR